MAIRIEARIEPNLTRMARIPRLHPNNDPTVVLNRDEYGCMRRKRHRITRIRFPIVGFLPNLDPNNSRIKKNMIFQEEYMGVQELYSVLFGLFTCILLCIRMAIRIESGSYSGHSRQIRLYPCYSSLFGSIIPVVPPPLGTNKPKSA